MTKSQSEAEDRRILEALERALSESRVDRQSWEVAYNVLELPYADECLCLFKRSDDAWVIGYAERGDWSWRGTFPDSLAAAETFYTTLTKGHPGSLHREIERASSGLDNGADNPASTE